MFARARAPWRRVFVIDVRGGGGGWRSDGRAKRRRVQEDEEEVRWVCCWVGPMRLRGVGEAHVPPLTRAQESDVVVDIEQCVPPRAGPPRVRACTVASHGRRRRRYNIPLADWLAVTSTRREVKRRFRHFLQT